MICHSTVTLWHHRFCSVALSGTFGKRKVDSNCHVRRDLDGSNLRDRTLLGKKHFPLYNKRCDPSEGYIRDNQLAVTYCSVAKKFTVATITVFAAVCSTIICWWRTLIDGWSVTWAAISTTAHTRGRPGWHIKPQSINVCKKRSRDISPGWTIYKVLSSQYSSVTVCEKKKKIAWGLFHVCWMFLIRTINRYHF